MKRNKPLLRKTKLSPVSKNKERRKKRFIPKEVMEQLRIRSNGLCEFPPRAISNLQGHKIYFHCVRLAVDPHHLLPKGRGGKNELSNLLHVCRFHHEWIHKNQDKAVKLKVLKEY